MVAVQNLEGEIIQLSAGDKFMVRGKKGEREE
jgi:hypothetical protein